MNNKFWQKAALSGLVFSMLTAGFGTAAWAESGKQTSSAIRAPEEELKLSFDDIQGGDVEWAAKPIASLATRPIFYGYPDGGFHPRKPINRLETLAFVLRLVDKRQWAESSEEMNAELPFLDSEDVSSWGVGYVSVGLKEKLISSSESHFYPRQGASRLWATKVTVKALGLEQEALSKKGAKLPFTDTNDLSDEDKGYLAVGVEKGLIYGYIEANGERTFRPDRIITRAQYAGILGNAGDLVPDPSLVKGRISAVAPEHSLQITTDLGETFTYSFYKGAHVYKNGSRVSAYALKAGDQIKLRHHYGSAAFIEVTKNAGITPDFTVTGEFEGMLVNGKGEITTVSLKRALNGSSTSTRYPVSPNVVIYGKESDLTANRMIQLDGKDGVIVAIYLIPQT